MSQLTIQGLGNTVSLNLRQLGMTYTRIRSTQRGAVHFTVWPRRPQVLGEQAWQTAGRVAGDQAVVLARIRAAHDASLHACRDVSLSHEP
jgi:hypothetical protein